MVGALTSRNSTLFTSFWSHQTEYLTTAVSGFRGKARKNYWLMLSLNMEGFLIKWSCNMHVIVSGNGFHCQENLIRYDRRQPRRSVVVAVSFAKRNQTWSWWRLCEGDTKNVQQDVHSQNVEDIAGWPRHRENREFGSYFFQTGKTGNFVLTQGKIC